MDLNVHLTYKRLVVHCAAGPNVIRGLDSQTDGLAHNADITVFGPPTMHVLYAR